MKLLRKTIRNILLEEYKLTDQDVQNIRGDNKMSHYDPTGFDRERPEGRIRKHWSRRGEGLQGTEPIKNDIAVMKQFNKSLNTDPRGKMIIDDFQSGKLHVLHSISYQGMYSRKSEFLRDPKPFSKWIQRFGKRGKDMVSVVACNSHFYEAPMLDRWKRKENALFVYDAGFGFIMKGYPAFIAHTDVMSQTLSAIPDTLKDHQKHSGIAKRAGDIDDALSFDDWYSGVGSDETLLDNWSIVGIFLGQEILHRNPELIIADAKSTGLDIYQVTPKRSLQKVN